MLENISVILAPELKIIIDISIKELKSLKPNSKNGNYKNTIKKPCLLPKSVVKYTNQQPTKK